MKNKDNDCIYGCVWTYSDLNDKEEVIISFIEEFVEKIINKYFDKKNTTFCAFGERVNSRERKFNSSWKKFKENFKDEYKNNIESLYVENNNLVHLSIDYFLERPKHSMQLIGISVERRAIEDKIPYEIFKEIVSKLYVYLECSGGFITIDNIGRYGGATAHERYIGRDYSWASREYKYKEYFRGYFWANYLNKTQVDILGGINKIKEIKDFYEVRELEDGGAYIQISEDINNYTDEQLRLLKNFFKPILMTRGDRLVDPKSYKYMRVIEDEDDKREYERILAERNKDNRKDKTIEEKDIRQDELLLSNNIEKRQEDINLTEEDEIEMLKKLRETLNIPIKLSEDLSLPDINIKIKMKEVINKEQENYITEVIESWYLIGTHMGFEKNRIHYLHDIVFDDKNNICVIVDMANCSPYPLKVLLTVLMDVFSILKIEPLEIILE